MPRIFQSAFYVLINLILRRCHNYVHFTDEETEAQRGKATCPRSQSSKWWGQDLNLGSQAESRAQALRGVRGICLLSIAVCFCTLWLGRPSLLKSHFPFRPPVLLCKINGCSSLDNL